MKLLAAFAVWFGVGLIITGSVAEVIKIAATPSQIAENGQQPRWSVAEGSRISTRSTR